MNEQLQNLLADWEIARQEGRQLDPAEMCKDYPELLDEFKDAIAKLLQTSWLFEEAEERSRSVHAKIPDLKSRLEFDDSLRASGLVSESAMGELSTELNSEQAAECLRESGLLTEYQSEVLLGYRNGPLKLDRYVILDEIGEGGMGKVYRALHTSMNRNVAIKMVSTGEVSEKRKQRFRREIQSVAALNHPNVVTAHDACEIDGQFFFVMELIEGNDLLHEVEANGPLPFDMALEVIQQIALATEAAHQQGIIHRDIKPSNILLANDGRAKLLDLGIARVQRNFDGSAPSDSTIQNSTEITGEGTPVGTVAYMSPEQALNAKHADARSDIYSLGCTLFYLLTGEPPFLGESVVETIVSHRETPVDQLLSSTEIDEKAKSLLRNMIAKDPSGRFGSMQALSEAIEGGELPTKIARSAVNRPHDRASRRFSASWPSWLFFWGAAVLLACLAGGAVWFSQNTNESISAESPTWQNDLARWVLNNSGTVVAKTEFGEQLFDTVEAIPGSPIEITELTIFQLPTGFSAQWLTRLSNLNFLNFEYCTLTSSDVVQLKQLEKLETLVLNGCEVPGSLWPTLQGLPRLTTLTVTEMELSDKDSENIGGVDQLTSLTINDSEFDDQQFKFIEKLTLTYLDLEGTDVGGRPVQWAATQSQLVHFDMSSTLLTDVDFESAEPCRSLQLVSFEGCEVGDAAIEYLMQLPEITDVFLGAVSLSESNIETIAKHPSISSLDLRGGNFQGALLGKFGMMTNLQYLGLASLEIDDSHMPMLAALDLDEIDLSGTKITDKGLAILSDGNLSQLVLVSCNLSQEALAAFLEQNPECLIAVEAPDFLAD